jgi:regulator of PEP synthase PpsR (kinase-PPPase family)
VRGIEPPADLYAVDPGKVVGLTINASRLAEIRSRRIQHARGSRRYAELEAIYDELEFAKAIHRKLGCPVLDVTDASVEETAHRIIRLVQDRSAKATV